MLGPIKISAGFCPDCESSFISVEIPGHPTIERHGLTKDDALRLQTEMALLLSGVAQPKLNTAELLNEMFRLLGVTAHAVLVPKGEAHGPLGKPRFG